MKRILLLILMLTSIELFAIPGYACYYLTINPSATDVAFGSQSGGANIWNLNPLDVWSNPAKLGYFKGISFGYSNDQWFDDHNIFDDIYFNSSYITLGWKGLGIMLPMYNKYGKTGSYFDSGEIGPWETNSEYAIGLNPFEIFSTFYSYEAFDRLKTFTDFSFGYQYSKVHSDLIPPEFYQDFITKGYGDSHTDGLGFICRFSPLNEFNNRNTFFKVDLVSSIYYFNPSKTKITYYSRSEPLPYSEKTAISFRLAMDVESIKETSSTSEYKIISMFCQDIFSVYASYDNEFVVDEYNTWGKGIEFTFFDLISFRNGHYTDKAGSIIGNTTGIGLNFKYKDLVHLQYNWVRFPGSSVKSTLT